MINPKKGSQRNTLSNNIENINVNELLTIEGSKSSEYQATPTNAFSGLLITPINKIDEYNNGNGNRGIITAINESLPNDNDKFFSTLKNDEYDELANATSSNRLLNPFTTTSRQGNYCKGDDPLSSLGRSILAEH